MYPPIGHVPLDIERIEKRLRAHQPNIYEGEKRLTPSAVLVPIIERSSGLELLFTLRRSDLGSHPGQVSFPGGRVDPEDVDSWATALRECEEEVGVQSRNIRSLGRLSDFPVITNFLITPWVAQVTDLGPYLACQREVAEIFTVPLARLRDLTLRRTAVFSRFAKEERVYFYHGGPHVIWGATAAILNELLEVLET